MSFDWTSISGQVRDKVASLDLKAAELLELLSDLDEADAADDADVALCDAVETLQAAITEWQQQRGYI